MKIILSFAILILFLANIFAEKTITCNVQVIEGQQGCRFSGDSIGPNDAVSINIVPADANVNTITVFNFELAPLHSIPSEVFTKFPNVKRLLAYFEGIQEIKPDTFVNAGKLEFIGLNGNKLSVLHADSFKGNFFVPLFAKVPQ